MLELELPRYIDDVWPTWKNDFTKIQSDMTFTDGGESFTLEIPEMLIESGANMETPGTALRSPSITLRAYSNQDNTPMLAITDEARITIV